MDGDIFRTTSLNITALAETLHYMAGITHFHADAIHDLELSPEAERELIQAIARCEE